MKIYVPKRRGLLTRGNTQDHIGIELRKNSFEDEIKSPRKFRKQQIGWKVNKEKEKARVQSPSPLKKGSPRSRFEEKIKTKTSEELKNEAGKKAIKYLRQLGRDLKLPSKTVQQKTT
jgi:hypothetical protein